MPIGKDRVDDVMTATAVRLAAEADTTLVLLYPIEVPLNVSMAAPLVEETAEGERQLREAAAIARAYGVPVVTRIVRTRNIGHAIVEEAERRRSEIIVLGARDRTKPGQQVFGPRVDYVLRNAHCRVMVGAEPAPV
jgi:nucleotide-binding universal stress UspA family protein